jgi:hypothetical protein
LLSDKTTYVPWGTPLIGIAGTSATAGATQGAGGNGFLIEEQLAVAKQAVARSVLSIMPTFDTLVRETGAEG